jgi:hypothetical protein
MKAIDVLRDPLVNRGTAHIRQSMYAASYSKRSAVST